MPDKNLMLTVNVITYNHEKYIAQCLDSIFAQKTDFNFVVRVFDDASTDDTQEILKQYKEKFEDKIQLFLAEKNLGKFNEVYINAIKSYQDITTPYYIYIEGDDKFCNAKRIQKQIEILEKNSDCSFCAMGTKLYFENQNASLPYFPKLNKDKYTLNYWIKNPEKYLFTHISSRMARTSCINIDKDHPEFFIMDTTQSIILLKQGPMYFLDKTGSCYNVTFNGTISGKQPFKKIQDICIFFENFNNYSKNSYEAILLHFLSAEVHGTVNLYNINHFKNKIKNFAESKLIVKKIKHYFIPKFILDIFNIPRDVSRFIRKQYKKLRGMNEFK